MLRCYTDACSKAKEIKKQPQRYSSVAAFCGGLEGIRTLDPRNANAMRSQLRYKPM